MGLLSRLEPAPTPLGGVAAIRPTDRFRLLRLPLRSDDLHPLLGCYLELVWAEVPIRTSGTKVTHR